jgi:hypothetical protein
MFVNPDTAISYPLPTGRLEAPQLLAVAESASGTTAHRTAESALVDFVATFSPDLFESADGSLQGNVGRLATSWLRQEAETWGDSQQTTAVLLTLFNAVETDRLMPASRALLKLRNRFTDDMYRSRFIGDSYPKTKPLGLDATYGFLARLDGRALLTRWDAEGLGERLTDEQFEALARLHDRYETGRRMAAGVTVAQSCHPVALALGAR